MKVATIMIGALLAATAATAATPQRTESSEAARTKIAYRLDHSLDVVRFFDNRGRWLRAPHHVNCSQVPWSKSCRIARVLYDKHLERAKRMQRRLDMTDPVVQKLNRGLRGTPMAGLGVTLRDIGRQYNISPFFMAAAAGTESSFGAAGCGNNPKNVWGLAACDGRWNVPYFETWDEAIRFYAGFLRSHWPSATSPYDFHGYAACGSCWGAKTSSWMSSRFGVSAYTKYPGEIL